MAKNKKNQIQTKHASETRTLLFKVLPYIIITSIAGLLYVQTLSFGFTGLDDTLIIRDKMTWLGNPGNVFNAFTRDAFNEAKGDAFYRPLQTITYMIDAYVSGGELLMFHLDNLLLHILTCCALFFLLTKMDVSRTLALTGSVLFSVHPLFTHAICWLPSRGDLLLGLSMMVSFIFFINYLKTGRIVALCFHGLFFVVALLSKETAVIFPGLLITWYLLFNRDKPVKQIAVPAVFAITASLAYILIRKQVIYSEPAAEFYGILPLLKNLPTIPITLAKLLLPLHMSPMPRFNGFFTVFGCFVISGLLLLIIKSKQENRIFFAFGTLWFVVFSLPPLLFRHPCADFGYQYLEHRAYVPMIGFIFFLPPLKRILSPIRERRFVKLTAFVILVFAAVSFNNAKNYTDPVAFNNAVLSIDPTNASAYNARGMYKFSSGDINGALEDYTKAISLYPKFFDFWYNRGVVREHLQDHNNAINDYLKAISLDSTQGYVYYNLGNIYADQNEYQRAIAFYSKSLQHTSDDPEVYNNRANVKCLTEDFHGALTDCDSALKLNPEFSEAYFNRGLVWYHLKNSPEALYNLSQSLRLKPAFAEAYYTRGLVYASVGERDKAEAEWQKAAELGSRAAGDSLANKRK